MCSAVLFLPSTIRTLTNRPTIRSLYFGSGSVSRFGTSRRRGIFGLSYRASADVHATTGRGRPSTEPGGRNGLLRSFGAVLRAAAVTGRHPGGVERAAHDVVPDTRKVLHAAAADQHDGVLLEVVALAGDVGVDLAAVGQPHARHLAQRRVRLLRRLREHAQAHAAPLRAAEQVGRLRARTRTPATESHELLNGGHERRAPRTGIKDTTPPRPTFRRRRDRKRSASRNPLRNLRRRTAGERPCRKTGGS